MSGSPSVAQLRTNTPELDSRRTSLISSSAASFHTAPSLRSHPSFRSDASSESVGTVAPIAQKNLDVNPLHLLSQAGQEVHVVDVGGDKVELHTGRPPKTFLQRAENSAARVVSCEKAAPSGPPPPSPPPSVERDDDNEKPAPFLRPLPSHQMHFTHSEPPQSMLDANDFALARQQSSTSSSSDGPSRPHIFPSTRLIFHTPFARRDQVTDVFRDSSFQQNGSELGVGPIMYAHDVRASNGAS